MALLDVEILVERVRGDKARSFINEAVLCYKAGAYRSCVVATWIALIYDFVEKFRELALSGDSAAKKLVLEFDRIQAARDTAAALKFEREVLDVARDEYELLSAQELVDLKRLFEDRNRFGHPNINQDAEVLDATPELARTHLRSAVEHVMQRPPVQGKVALAAIQAVVESPHFPIKVDEAKVVLASTPLVRAKNVVVREFFLGCVTSLIREKLTSPVFERRRAAALAARSMHRSAIDEFFGPKLKSIFDATADEYLDRLIVLLGKDPDFSACVSPALELRLKSYVRTLADSNLIVLNFVGNLKFLSSVADERLALVTASQLRDFVQRAASEPAPAVVRRAIEILENSKSWDSSNAVISAISERMLDLIGQAEAKRILASNSNGEVKWSFSFPEIIKKLVSKGLLTEQDVKKAAAEGGDGQLTALYEATA